MKSFTLICVVISIWSCVESETLPGNDSIIIAPVKTKAGSRIVNGQLVSATEKPYQIVLYAGTTTTYYFTCSGSIISDQWVLTAANCIKPPNNYAVRAGSLNINQGGTLLVVTAANAFKHPSYNPITMENDVALLRLPSALPFSSTISAVLLSRAPCYAGETVTVSGWGRMQTSGPVSAQLNKLSATVISNTQCSAFYPDNVYESTMCTLSSGSICFGDGGGPVTSVINGFPKLCGVISFVTNSGCESPYPNGHARVSSFVPWIVSMTGVPTYN